MNEDRIRKLVEENRLKPRSLDKARASSILLAAEQIAEAAQAISLTDIAATIVFREVYESVRQLGDAKWWLIGYEPWGHDVSIEFLMEENETAFQHLDRFRRIRNDANYRGYKVTIEQAQEIVRFWKEQGTRLLEQLKNKAK